jgi:fatty-acyl-CoA synthase
MAKSYTHGGFPTHLIGQTIGDNLQEAVTRYPDSEAVVSVKQAIRWSYSSLNEHVDQVARGLLALGLGRGDRIGIWSPNCAEWVLVQYATARLGAILVNINPAYRTHELEYALNQSGCRFLISATSHRTTDYREMVTRAQANLRYLERTIYLATPDWDELLTAGGNVPVDRLRAVSESLDFDDPINIQYTSGTTGFPKGATLTHHNILNNGFFVGEICGYTNLDRVCIPVPFYHCFGMVIGNLACTTHGSAIVIPGPTFDALDVLECVATEHCTSLYGVPTMFIAELQHPRFGEFDLSSLRTGMMAGAPCPVEVMRQVVDRMHMREVTIGYGMTETSPVSTQTAVDDPLERQVGTVGRVHPHVEVKIVDPATGEQTERGGAGELCTRGYSVMRGYWNDPERTSEAIDTAGWMHTGDLATMDDQGYLNIVGRIKDVIIRGGENVYPREVEEFLFTHPSVVDVQVIGVPDPYYGEEVMAWVKRKDGASVTADDLRLFCRDQIARYKIPRYIHFADQFPMTVTGKVQKFKMREEAIQLLGLGELAATSAASTPSQ